MPPQISATFLSSNPNKISEASQILPGIHSQNPGDLTEIQSLDPKIVLQAKLEEAVRKGVAGDIFVDDTSLFFTGVGKGALPGTLIKLFLLNYTLEELVDLAHANSASGRALALCTIGYRRASGEFVFSEGRLEGSIVPPRGENGFGWDKIFQPYEHSKTLAEMSDDEKNSMSHRRLALEALRIVLKS